MLSIEIFVDVYFITNIIALINVTIERVLYNNIIHRRIKQRNNNSSLATYRFFFFTKCVFSIVQLDSEKKIG